MGDKPVPDSWRGQPVVVLLGGPWGRRWYFEADLTQLVESRRRIGLPWHYRQTIELHEHPVHATVGAIHRYRPAAAAGLRARR